MTFTRLLLIITIGSCSHCNAMERPHKSQSAPEIITKSPRMLATSERKVTFKPTTNEPINLFVALRQKRDLTKIIPLMPIFDANKQEEGTGQTLLHYCVFNKAESIIKYLMLEKKADPHIKNYSGRSALDTAIDYGFTHIASVINECLRDDLYAQAQSSIKAKTK